MHTIDTHDIESTHLPESVGPCFLRILETRWTRCREGPETLTKFSAQDSTPPLVNLGYMISFCSFLGFMDFYGYMNSVSEFVLTSEKE